MGDRLFESEYFIGRFGCDPTERSEGGRTDFASVTFLSNRILRKGYYMQTCPDRVSILSMVLNFRVLAKALFVFVLFF